MLNASDIDSIFAIMLTRYGSAWEAKYRGLDPDDVRGDWFREIHRFDRDSVRYALEHLPLDFPPNVGQFREMCRRAPQPQVEQIAEAIPTDRARMLAALRRLHEIAKDVKPRDWIARLEARKAAGETLSEAQLLALANAKATPDVGQETVDHVALVQAKRDTDKRVQDYARTHGIDL